MSYRKNRDKTKNEAGVQREHDKQKNMHGRVVLPVSQQYDQHKYNKQSISNIVHRPPAYCRYEIGRVIVPLTTLFTEFVSSLMAFPQASLGADGGTLLVVLTRLRRRAE